MRVEIKFQHMEGRYCVTSLIGIREGKSLMEKKSYTSPPAIKLINKRAVMCSFKGLKL